MSFLSSIVDKFGGGIIKEGFNVIKSYFPPSMSDKEKAEAEMAYQAFMHGQQMDVARLANDAEKEFNDRIKTMEGTAADLKTIPIIGHLIIFLRGTQRPAWGVFVLYADYQVFSKAWDLSGDPQLRSMLFAVNILVLGFLFGERAVKNILPFVKEFLGVKKQNG